MYGREYFHESVVKDIVDVITSLKDYDEVQFINNSRSNRSFKSITSATKDLILTFPVLVSTDIDPETATMIAKAHEKKCASLLHILFTAISVESNEDVYDYVKKFHSNLGSLNGTLDSYADSFDKLAASFEGYDQTLTIDKKVLDYVLEDLKESNYVLPDDITESSIEEYKIVPGYRTGMDDIIINESKHKPRSSNTTSNYNGTTFSGNSVNFDNRDQSRKTSNFNDYNGTVNNRESHDKNTTNIYYGKDDKKSATGSMKDRNAALNYGAELHSKTILNNEYKKANELQPTMMVINFIRKSEDGPDSINTAVIGIKAKIYAVDSSDICNRINRKLEDKNFLTNFVRATTNEIGFFRDFLFAVDTAKIDAQSYGRKASSNKLWKVLERRSSKSKFRRSLKMYNDATAISTLVVSENDVEYLKKNNGIDLSNVGQARKLLDSYNFMCICIANESTEVASFLYDTGDDNYEMISFTGLEREASDNSYKKMVNLLSRMTR